MDRELAPGMASELKIIDELRRRNLPYQHRVQIDHYEVDIVVGRRIIVEVDGYVHAAKETIEKDQRKELYLHDQGFTVLRITGNEVRNRGRVRDFGRRIQELYTKEQSPLTVQNAKPLTQTLVNEGLLKLRQQLGDEELANRQRAAVPPKRKTGRKQQEPETPDKQESDEEVFRRYLEQNPVHDKDTEN